MAALNSDSPKVVPKEDKLGLSPHAEQLARTLADHLQSKEGEAARPSVVVGIEGPWGSGKSTYLNFLRHYFQANVQNDECRIISFDPWWLSDGENLLLPFLRTLISELPADRRGEFVAAVTTLVRSSRHIPDWLIELTQDADGKPNWIGRLLRGAKESGGSLEIWMTRGKSPRSARDEAAAALLKAKMGLVVFVDDIDRLRGSELLDVLKFVKSVGDLPRVVYLLAYDRGAIQDALSEAEVKKPHEFLEKIIQVVVPLPKPTPWRMRNLALDQLSSVLGIPTDKLATDDRIDAVIFSLLKKPRDLARLSNNTGIVLQKVRGEVDLVDFACLQAIRSLDHDLYEVIAAHKGLLTDDFTSTLMSEIMATVETTESKTDRWKQALSLEHDVEGRRQRILAALFPRCPLWNSDFDEKAQASLEQRRAIGLSRYFDTYLSLEVSPGVMSKSEVDALLKITDPERLVHELRALADGKNASIDHFLDVLEAHKTDEASLRAALVLFGRNADFLLFPDRARSWQLGLRIARIVAEMLRAGPASFKREVIRLSANANTLIASGPFAWLVARDEGVLGHQTDKEQLQELVGGLFDEAERAELHKNFSAAMATQARYAKLFDLPGTPRVIFTWNAWDPRSASAWARGLVRTSEGLEAWLHGYAGYSIGLDTIGLYFGDEKNFSSALDELKQKRPDLSKWVDDVRERVSKQFNA